MCEQGSEYDKNMRRYNYLKSCGRDCKNCDKMVDGWCSIAFPTETSTLTIKGGEE